MRTFIAAAVVMKKSTENGIAMERTLSATLLMPLDSEKARPDAYATTRYDTPTYLTTYASIAKVPTTRAKREPSTLSLLAFLVMKLLALCRVTRVTYHATSATPALLSRPMGLKPPCFAREAPATITMRAARSSSTAIPSMVLPSTLVSFPISMRVLTERETLVATRMEPTK